MKDWKRLEQDSRRADRNSSVGYKKKVAAFKEMLSKPFDVTKKAYSEILKKSGIINWDTQECYLFQACCEM